ncbi:MAG: hypothetical protein GX442_15405 [Candidatus Riflebacteria bacterium]|nr:hypothetical protein [Candidatus Riflebacteria bacterium]
MTASPARQPSPQAPRDYTVDHGCGWCVIGLITYAIGPGQPNLLSMIGQGIMAFGALMILVGLVWARGRNLGMLFRYLAAFLLTGGTWLAFNFPFAILLFPVYLVFLNNLGKFLEP